MLMFVQKLICKPNFALHLCSISISVIHSSVFLCSCRSVQKSCCAVLSEELSLRLRNVSASKPRENGDKEKA